MTLLAACIAGAYLYLEVRTRVHNTGLFVLSLAFIFQTISSLFIRDTARDSGLSAQPGPRIPCVRRDPRVHRDSRSPPCTACCTSCSTMRSSRSRFGIDLQPPSESGDAGDDEPSGGGVRVRDADHRDPGRRRLAALVFTDISYLDPKLIGTIAIWFLYAMALMAKRRSGWQGRKTMIVSLVGFCFVFLSMIVINLYLSSFHTFH